MPLVSRFEVCYRSIHPSNNSGHATIFWTLADQLPLEVVIRIVEGEAENSPEEQCFYWQNPLQLPPSICLATSRETTYAFESSSDVNVFSLTPVKYAFQVLPLFPTDGTVGSTQGNKSEFTSQKCNNNNNNTSAEL
jgi:hypothetical protein